MNHLPRTTDEARPVIATVGEEDSIERFLERLRFAWDAGDAHAYAREFTEDAIYVIFLGEALLGRDAIEQSHELVFRRWQRGTRMRVRPIEVRCLDAEAVSVLTVGGIGKGAVVPLDKLQTYTLVRRNGRWVCQTFQNTKMSKNARRRYDLRSFGVLETVRRLLGRASP